MEAIRKIMTVKDNMVNVELPDALNNKKIELIILPVEGSPFVVEEESADYYSKYYGTMKSNLSEEDLDKKLKSLREEWNRDIS